MSDPTPNSLSAVIVPGGRRFGRLDRLGINDPALGCASRPAFSRSRTTRTALIAEFERALLRKQDRVIVLRAVEDMQYVDLSAGLIDPVENQIRSKSPLWATWGG